MPCRMPSFLAFVIVACCCVSPVAVASAAGSAASDSSAVPRKMRVFSRRAVFDLNPPPLAQGTRASTRALDDSLHLRLPSPGGAYDLLIQAEAGLVSVTGTLVPIVMLANWGDPDTDNPTVLAAGLAFAVLGPGFGYLYAGIPGEALPGQLLRAGALGLATFTVFGPWTDSESDVGGAVGSLLISSIVFAGATLYDLGNTMPAVERANDRRREAAMAVGLRPLPGGRPALALTVRF